ncbi:CAMK family protein kinase [Tritrichomonas foetus]|uniref:CAMK family protein kinase n=1 Tax=Tritrichomonas foetus TaxID=1144522 RepID=A0A1J4L107_9EUKA|nr:CAMK family protein kinase [Tritrichomonas foetus]|eukprot:OHT15644.1 CAMK family protein kinase [Tritrichomonas foetus]
MQHPHVLSESYIFADKLGSGAYSCVFKAVHILTGLNVAIKIIEKNTVQEPEAYKRFIQEIDILKMLNHPNIAHFYELIEDESNYYIVLEYCERGTVTNFIEANGKSESNIKKTIFNQLLEALSYLYDKLNIIHCDIKADNVLLDEFLDIKLIDFGFASHVNNSYQDRLIRGSPAYIAPEVFQGAHNTPSSEIWSLGIFLYLITTGKLPYDDEDMDGLMHSIVNMKPIIQSYLTHECSDLISLLLNKSPEKRPTFEEIKKHCWFNDLDLKSHAMINMCIETGFHNKKDIDNEIIEEMESFNYDPNAIYHCLFTNEFNTLTTTYKLLLKKKTSHMKRRNSKNRHVNPVLNLSPISRVSSVPKFKQLQLSGTAAKGKLLRGTPVPISAKKPHRSAFPRNFPKK